MLPSVLNIHMGVYNLEKLMEETRRIAAEYRRSTGQTLPVSAELAKYDAVRLLNLETLDSDEPQQASIDAYLESADGRKAVQIKSRVIFSELGKQRVGQLNIEANWDLLFLVLMNEEYHPTYIYQLSKEVLESFYDSQDKHPKSNARGALSVKRFIALAEEVWSHN